MNDWLVKKGLVIASAIMFLSVAFAPSININVVKASTNNDMVEVTTEACGITGFGDNTVKLTKQQYQNLEQYLVDFRERLNKTTTREEAVPIFNEVVVELNKYNLFPKGMTIRLVQKLISMNSYNFHSWKKTNENANLFFFIAGNIVNFCFSKLFVNIITSIIKYIPINIIFQLLLLIDFIKMGWLYYFPLVVNECIGLGGDLNVYPGGDFFSSINLVTIGLNGIKSWNGRYKGNLLIPGYSGAADYYSGILGFTGIRITSSLCSGYIIGSAIRMKITPEIQYN